MLQTLNKRFELDSTLTYIQPRKESMTPDELLKSIKRSSKGNDTVQDLHFHSIEADRLHFGYYNYLQHCWSCHAVPVVSPEIIWQILMSVMSERVCAKPDLYREVFARHEGKQSLVVNGALDNLESFAEDTANLILMLAPDDIHRLLPNFSTASKVSRMAQAVALMSTTSPYYDYSMMMCGFPAVEVRGTDEDWALLMESWGYVKDVLSRNGDNAEWLSRAGDVLSNVCQNFNNLDTWKNLFASEKCGSGSDVTLDGWIVKLAFQVGKYHHPINTMPTAVANADFEYLPTGKHYRIFAGVLGSNTKDGVAEPVYGCLLANKAEV